VGESEILGAMAALTFAFAGANVGTGPGPDAVIFSARLSTIALFGFWAVLEFSFHVSERITIDRDLGGGLRLAGSLAAAGLISGRAVAGDWVSMGSTVHDFVIWELPAIVPLAMALAFECACRRSDEKNAAAHALRSGALPALALLASGVAWVMMQPPVPVKTQAPSDAMRQTESLTRSLGALTTAGSPFRRIFRRPSSWFPGAYAWSFSCRRGVCNPWTTWLTFFFVGRKPACRSAPSTPHRVEYRPSRSRCIARHSSAPFGTDFW
jgi:hypothetical protein